MKTSPIKNLILFLALIVNIPAVFPQELGSWQSYRAYYQSTLVTETPNKVFAVYDGSLLSYSSDNELKLYCKTDGLNDVDIVRMGYSNDLLVLIYNNLNIDLMTNEGVYNLAGVKESASVTSANLYNLEFYGEYAYLSYTSGIIVIDLKRKEIKDTYRLNKATYSVCILGDYIYASTDEGIVRAFLTSNLLSGDSWEAYPLNWPDTDIHIEKLMVLDNKILFHKKNKGIYSLDVSSGEISLIESGVFNQVNIFHKDLVAIGNGTVTFFSGIEKKASYNITCNAITSLNNQDTYWISHSGTQKGLGSLKKSNGEMNTPLTVNRPKRNYTFYMTHEYGKLLVVGDGGFIDRSREPAGFSIYENGEWLSIDEEEIEKNSNVIQCKSFTWVVTDPLDHDHYFVSSYGEGVYEFYKNKFYTLHNDITTNGILQSALPNYNPPHIFVRVSGMFFDKDNNLIMNNYLVQNSIVIYDNKKEWHSLKYENMIEIPDFKVLIPTSQNQKWACSLTTASDTKGVWIIDDKGTLLDTTDDDVLKGASFTDQDGILLDITQFTCIAEDRNGTIWVGTSAGPIVFYNPLQIIRNKDFSTCSRIKIPYNDGTDEAFYLLEDIPVTCIAIDGANRKWIGTSGSGLYLVNAAADEVLANFTTQNSPLISDVINSLAIDNETGEIFIGTDKGIVSYMNIATEGKSDYSNVYAYPNPVRPDFTGEVVITGLIENSNVKITDLNGNLLYEGKSLGGQISWNCKNRQGERVNTGVYLVFGATSDGGQGVVTKIVVHK